MSALSIIRRYSLILFDVSRYRFLVFDALLQCLLFYYGVVSFTIMYQPHPRWPVVLSLFTFINFEISLTMTLMEPCNHRIKTRAAVLFLNVFYTFWRLVASLILLFAKIEPSHTYLADYAVDQLSWDLFLFFSLSTSCTIGIIAKSPYLQDPFARDQL